MVVPMRFALPILALSGLLLMASEAPQKTDLGPEVGQPAPAFRLNDHNGNAASIGGEKDTWTVVAFYPKALTPG